MKILTRAAELLRIHAEELKAAHTIAGQWSDDEPEAKAAYDELVDVAQELASDSVIAAAPELLAAAQRILKMMDVAFPDKPGGLDYLRDAIAKATGAPT